LNLLLSLLTAGLMLGSRVGSEISLFRKPAIAKGEHLKFGFKDGIACGVGLRCKTGRALPMVLCGTTPATFSRGRLIVATKPSRPGSLPVVNTIGAVLVAFLAASAANVVLTMTAGLRAAALLLLKTPITGSCCALATSGHAGVAAPPRILRISRRLMPVL
jgi:hypothetical protein